MPQTIYKDILEKTTAITKLKEILEEEITQTIHDMVTEFVKLTGVDVLKIDIDTNGLVFVTDKTDCTDGKGKYRYITMNPVVSTKISLRGSPTY